jgi:hypothetical protein
VQAVCTGGRFRACLVQECQNVKNFGFGPKNFGTELGLSNATDFFTTAAGKLVLVDRLFLLLGFSVLCTPSVFRLRLDANFFLQNGTVALFVVGPVPLVMFRLVSAYFSLFSLTEYY